MAESSDRIEDRVDARPKVATLSRDGRASITETRASNTHHCGMGVKGLTPFLRRFAPGALRALPLADLAGAHIAVDGDQTLWRLFHGYNFAGNTNNHRYLWGFRRLVGSLRARGIEPIFAFDAGPGLGPKLKSREHRIRSAKRDGQHIRSEALKRAATLLAVVAEGIERGKIDAGSLAIQRLRESFAEPVRLSKSAETVLAQRVPTGARPGRAELVNPTADIPLLPERSANPAQVRDVLNTTAQYLSSAMANFQELHTHVSDGSVSKSLKTTASDILNELGQLASSVAPQPVEGAPQASLKDMTVDERHDLADRIRQLSDLQYTRSQTLSTRVLLPPRSILVNELQELLSLLGVQMHTAPPGYEGECLAASICAAGIAQGGVMSTDTDTCLYGLAQTGGLRLIAPPPAPKMKEHVPDKLDTIDTRTALAELGLTGEQFVDLCLLLGTDFAPTLPGIGPVKAYKLIRQFGSINAFLDSGSYSNPLFTDQVRRDTVDSFDEARELFGKLVDVSDDNFVARPLADPSSGMDRSRDFLMELASQQPEGEDIQAYDDPIDIDLDGAYQK